MRKGNGEKRFEELKACDRIEAALSSVWVMADLHLKVTEDVVLSDYASGRRAEDFGDVMQKELLINVVTSVAVVTMITPIA